MGIDDLLNLAREDFDQQEKASRSAGRTLQFTLTLGTLIGTAAVAISRITMLDRWPAAQVVGFLVFANVDGLGARFVSRRCRYKSIENGISAIDQYVGWFEQCEQQWLGVQRS